VLRVALATAEPRYQFEAALKMRNTRPDTRMYLSGSEMTLSRSGPAWAEQRPPPGDDHTHDDLDWSAGVVDVKRLVAAEESSRIQEIDVGRIVVVARSRSVKRVNEALRPKRERYRKDWNDEQ
jgi:hypothetical protein